MRIHATSKHPPPPYSVYIFLHDPFGRQDLFLRATKMKKRVSHLYQLMPSFELC